MRDGITHLHLLRVLDTADDITHIARPQLLTGNHVHFQHTDLIGIVLHTRIEEFHVVARTYHTVGNLKIGNNPTERVEYRVEDQGLEGCILVTFRVGDALYNGIQDILHSLARLSGSPDDV